MADTFEQRGQLPENIRNYFNIAFSLQMGSMLFLFGAVVHLATAASEARLWHVPLAIGCLICSLLLAVMSFPSRYRDLPRFKRLMRPYIAIALPYFLIQVSRLLFWAGGQARERGAGWAIALVVSAIAVLIGMNYFALRRDRHSKSSRPEAEQFAETALSLSFSTFLVVWL